jgi:ABC-type transport system involved in resistance to organic solvents, periplasmic component
MQKSDLKTRIITTALLIIAGAVVFYFVKKNKMAKEHDYFAYFYDVKGLQPSSPVQINGVRVGKIAGIELLEDRLKVTITTKKGIDIPTGTVAELASGGMTGDKIVNLIPGKGPEMLPDQSTLITKLDTALLPLSVRITPMLNMAKFMLRSTDSSLTAFNYLLNAKLIGSTASTLIYLDEELQSYAKLSASVNHNIDGIVNSINSAAQSTRELQAKNSDINATIKSADSNTRKLANRQLGEDVKKLQASIKGLGDSWVNMNKSQSLTDKNSYNSISSNLKNMDTSIKETMKDPPGFVIFGSSKKKKK